MELELDKLSNIYNEIYYKYNKYKNQFVDEYGF